MTQGGRRGGRRHVKRARKAKTEEETEAAARTEGVKKPKATGEEGGKAEKERQKEKEGPWQPPRRGYLTPHTSRASWPLFPAWDDPPAGPRGSGRETQRDKRKTEREWGLYLFIEALFKQAAQWRKRGIYTDRQAWGGSQREEEEGERLPVPVPVCAKKTWPCPGHPVFPGAIRANKTSAASNSSRRLRGRHGHTNNTDTPRTFLAWVWLGGEVAWEQFSPRLVLQITDGFKRSKAEPGSVGPRRRIVQGLNVN